ncbi:MAG TPA: DUF1508 domain-containing protein [Phycisphaerae bacterium]|nr:DUF1508 domain-containing protein [Phycisphaerae bacterium]
MKFQIYYDGAWKYRWRLKAANGRILADSGQGYKRKRYLMQTLELTILEVRLAPIQDLTKGGC